MGDEKKDTTSEEQWGRKGKEMPWKRLPVSSVRFIAIGVMVFFFILACLMRTDFFSSKWLIIRAGVAFDDSKKEALYLESIQKWESEAACKGLVKGYLKKGDYMDASIFIEKLSSEYKADEWVRSQLVTIELEPPKPSIAEGTYNTPITIEFTSGDESGGNEIHIEAGPGVLVEGNTVSIMKNGAYEIKVYATNILGIASKKKTYRYEVMSQ